MLMVLMETSGAASWPRGRGLPPHTWAPSHLDQPEATRRSVPWIAGEGNRRADLAAKAAALARGPPAQLVDDRAAELADLAVAQRVIAAVQVAVLATAAGHRGRPPRSETWALIRSETWSAARKLVFNARKLGAFPAQQLAHRDSET